MSNRHNNIMEFIWLFVMMMAAGALFHAIFRGETSDAIIFAIILITSAGMWFLRRNKRKNN